MTLSNWMKGDRIVMWLQINTVWQKAKVIPSHWINSWVHVCISADTHSGNISLSVKGDPPSKFYIPELKEEKPKNLQGKLFVGLSENEWDGKRQFIGQVANLNIFSDTFIDPLCTDIGDIVNFDSEWIKVGRVTEKNNEKWKICHDNNTYEVPIQKRITWNDAKKLCRKLGGGNITEAKSERELKQTISLFSNTTCDYVWTPLLDTEKEGEFKSDVTGNFSVYLPWNVNQPNGGIEDNCVTFRLSDESYYDVPCGSRYCVACEVFKKTVFSLRGVAEGSYFGMFVL